MKNKTLLLPKEFAAIANGTTQDDSRYALSGVHVRNLNGRAQMEVTDGHIMVRVTQLEVPKTEDYPEVAGLTDADNSAGEALIPGDAWKKAFKALPKRQTIQTLNNIVLQMGGEESVLGSTDLDIKNIMPVRNLTGQFPNTDMVIPTDEPVFTIHYDAVLIRRLLDIIIKLAPNDRHVITRMDFYKNGKGPATLRRLVARGEGDEYEVLAAIMPIAGDIEPVSDQPQVRTAARTETRTPEPVSQPEPAVAASVESGPEVDTDDSFVSRIARGAAAQEQHQPPQVEEEIDEPEQPDNVVSFEPKPQIEGLKVINGRTVLVI
jgi:hypothetical protein